MKTYSIADYVKLDGAEYLVRVKLEAVNMGGLEASDWEIIAYDGVVTDHLRSSVVDKLVCKTIEQYENDERRGA